MRAHTSWSSRFTSLAAMLVLGVAALVQSAEAASIKGKIGAKFNDGSGFDAEFDCSFASGVSGACTGNLRITEHPEGCSNSITLNGTMALIGLDLSQPGPISGQFQHTEPDFNLIHNPNGTCGATWNPSNSWSEPFTGTWNGTTASISFTAPESHEGVNYTITGGFTLEADPPFPMTVTSQIDAVSATAQAAIQFRPQDVGTSSNVYVFALAPATRVQGVTATTLKVGTAKRADGFKTDAVPCVLAQLNQAGQLTAASASSLIAYSSGVLSASGQSVAILNNVATPGVSGATMFVGYGTSSGGMINDGINRAAVTVPGAVECRPEAPQTGWWWNTAEGGRGYSIERQGRNIFMAAYFYDASGRATWQVASGPTTLEGALFTAPLYTCSGGVTLAGAYRANSCATAGNVTLAFNTASTGTMIWPGGTVGIERFNIVANGLTTAPLANQPENGWWWSAAENGRGFFIEWQGGTADIAGYMYDDAGNPIWYITVISTPNPLAMNGAWWQFANGMTQSGPYRAATRTNDNVGAATIQFTSATAATMTLPGGRQIPLTRFRF
ncbi:hypothetical protein [Usitatibacter palustris]|uniref:Uncharacterized protein n=1 Tax=Usitatibacter palustris TaxID=2732487 RepID=A0A6M4H440_9PROT|nr:hypothetical protein [Usitatibacter palustris]QJR14339.1 hypothetical protein DSM104440_01135 [Usitatibacter palustris]